MSEPRRRRLAAAVAAGLTLAVAAPVAQEVFRVATDVVLLSVTVTGTDNRAVTGLGRDDFQIAEDNVLQEIAWFSRDPQPIALSILIDSSISMDKTMPVAQEAAIGFVRRLGSNDLAQIIDFDTRAVIAQPFTGDRQALEAAIRSTEAGGSTSLYLSLYIALSEMARVRVPVGDAIRRQAIVVLSDGDDTTSSIDYEQVLDQSRRSEVTVYAIGLRPKTRPDAGREFSQAEFVLRTLSQETGGRVFFVSDAGQLPAVYRQISDELASQYTIAYRSRNLRRDGAWRRVAVQVVGRSAVARTKLGYYAPKVRP